MLNGLDRGTNTHIEHTAREVRWLNMVTIVLTIAGIVFLVWLGLEIYEDWDRLANLGV